MEYYDKYIKYKQKYLELKKHVFFQLGGWKMNELFPEKEGIDYSKLQITPEGEYSITRRDDGKILLDYITSVLKSTKDKTITDLTGNVGGDTILFGLNFKSVKSIEINPENYNVLENNVNVYGLNNVELHLGDSIKLYDWYTDVLYVDPPWGGPSYKDKKNLDLYLGDCKVSDFLKIVIKRKNRPKYIFLKVPKNYNFNSLYKLGRVRIKKIRNYRIVIIDKFN